MIQSATIIIYQDDQEKFFNELEMCISDTSRKYIIQCSEDQNHVFELSYSDDGNKTIYIDATIQQKQVVPNIILIGTNWSWRSVPLSTTLHMKTRGYVDKITLKNIRELMPSNL